MNVKKKHALMSGLLAAMVFTGPIAHAEGQTIKLTQLSDSDAYSTAAVINNYAKDSYKSVYIASGNTYSDALAGGVLAGEKDAALLFTDGKTLDQKSMDIVKNASKVYVVGGTATISEEFVKSLPKKATRLAGANRYETAASIAQTLGTNRDITIVNGQNYADTLASTALSIEENRNILLVDAGEMPPATEAYLKRNGNKVDIIFVGGEKSVSTSVKEEAFDLAGKNKANIEKSTIAGANRYETAAKIAQRFEDAKNLIVANGESYIDALAASALSKVKSAPVVLADGDYMAGIKKTGLDFKALDEIILLGDDKAVSSDAAAGIVAQADGIAKDQVKITTVDDTKQPNLSTVKEPAEKGQDFSGYIVGENLNVRAERSWDSEKLGVLKIGTAVKGILYGEWLQIDYNGKTGYLNKQYLSTDKPQDKTETQTEAKKEAAKETSQVTDKRQAFIDAALKMDGWSYSQSKRMQDGYSDCSSLVLRAMINSGVTSDKSNLTSRSIASDSRFESISKEELKPGDVLWMSGHLAIYVGEGKTFEARSSTQKVGYSTMGTRFSKFYRIKGI